MHAYLIAGEDSTEIRHQIKNLAKSKTLMPFILQKIADVRELSQFTKLTVRSETVVIIKDVERTTIEAQNAFLKILEEPQKNLQFVLVANNLKNILPTILSRVQIIKVGETAATKKQQEKADYFWSSKKSEKLELIKKIKARDEAQRFLESIIKGARGKLAGNPELTRPLETAIYALDAINKNGNVKLQLTNFVVNGC